MTTQINIRVDDQTVRAIDELVAEEGVTRAEVVRDAVARRLAEVKGDRVDAAYERAYTEHPETPDELRQAERAAARLTGDEPWEPWWVARGELWWLETPDDQGRPVLVISRNRANQVMRRVTIAPVTRTLRRAPSQLPVGPAEGLPAESVANFDDLASVPKALLVHRIGELGPRANEVCVALWAMSDCCDG